MIHICLIFDIFMRDSGLIDEGESAEIAALRELKEETGFKGEVVGVTPGIIGTDFIFDCSSFQSCVSLVSCAGGVFHTDFNTLFIWMAVTCLDPGLSNCTTQIIMVNINGDEAENINPTQQLGELMGLFYVHACPFYSMGAYMVAGEDISMQTSRVGVEILLLVD